MATGGCGLPGGRPGGRGEAGVDAPLEEGRTRVLRGLLRESGKVPPPSLRSFLSSSSELGASSVEVDSFALAANSSLEVAENGNGA